MQQTLAQLNDRSLTEETRIALEHWVEHSKSDPAVLKRAEAVRAQIEYDAATKRDAIAAVLGGDGTTQRVPAKKPTPTTKSASTKATASGGS